MVSETALDALKLLTPALHALVSTVRQQHHTLRGPYAAFRTDGTEPIPSPWAEPAPAPLPPEGVPCADPASLPRRPCLETL